MLRYGTKVRSEACRRMLAGERVEAMAGELEVSQATLYRWKRQALVDAAVRVNPSETGWLQIAVLRGSS